MEATSCHIIMKSLLHKYQIAVHFRDWKLFLYCPIQLIVRRSDLKISAQILARGLVSAKSDRIMLGVMPSERSRNFQTKTVEYLTQSCLYRHIITQDSGKPRTETWVPLGSIWCFGYVLGFLSFFLYNILRLLYMNPTWIQHKNKLASLL